MAHTFPADTGFCYFNAAPVTDNAFVPDFFIFTTMAFPVLAGSKYPFTEQTIFFRL